MKSLISAILVLSIVTLGACRSNDLGTGTNTVDREYSKAASEVCKAVLHGAESAKLTVMSDRHDQMGGELVASRGDGKEVRISVKSIDEKNTRVSIRVEPGDRDLANMMHERIAGNLGMGEAKTGWWFGGNSLDATYSADLPSCMTSARRAIVSLAQNTKDEEIHATWGQIDGRLKDSTPVRIKMEKADDKKTRVWFTVGSSKSDDNKAFAQKLKDEFETTTRAAGGSQ
jgi:hypothetical protein